MNVKKWLVKLGASVIVAIPAPLIIAAAVAIVAPVSEQTVSTLVDSQVSHSEWLVFLSVAVAAFLLVIVAQAIAEPLAVRYEEDDREEGMVKWFNVSKGFGFVTRDSGEDVFVHFRSIRGRGHRSLQEGQKVRFGVVESSKGLQAEDVTIIRQK